MPRIAALLASAALCALAAPAPALAAQPDPAEAAKRAPYRHIRATIRVEVQNDAAYRSGEPDHERNDLDLTIEPTLSARVAPDLSVEAGLVLEPVLDAEPGTSSWLGDEGLFLETLFLEWQRDRLSLHVGKFNPAFGVAWDVAPGIYGADFAEDYELTERVGLGGFAELGNDRIGRLRLGADLFFLDHGVLSRSAITDRGRTRLSDGGPSNTGKPESFSLTLEGGEIPAIPGLSYNLGYAYQRAGRAGRSERDYVTGLTYATRPVEGIDVALLGEYVHQDNADGEAKRRQYLTLSTAAFRGSWNLALSYTLRDREVRGEGGTRDYLFQVSAGYARRLRADARFGEVGIDVGWRLAREDGIRTDTIGARLSYLVSF
jgi:hypothetical protein